MLMASGSGKERHLKRTLGSGDKLKLKADFDFVKMNARKYSGSLFTLLIVKCGEDESPELKCGVICSRKFDKRAVVRNRARRLIWESFRLLKGRIMPCRMILIPRREITLVKMHAVMEQMEILLTKARLLDISPK